MFKKAKKGMITHPFETLGEDSLTSQRNEYAS